MLSKEYIETYMSKFRASHKGLKDLKIKVFSTVEEAFPLVDKEERDKKALAGAYFPESNVVLIIAENNKNIKELHSTIRHEIFGHLALNRLSEIDKYDLLQTIAEASSDSWVGKYRDYLSMTSYKILKDQPLMLAEEVVAHAAELSFSDIGRYESIPDPTMVESREDLLAIIEALKNGIHHGILEQKIFPTDDLALFKVLDSGVNEEKIRPIFKDVDELLRKNTGVIKDMTTIDRKDEDFSGTGYTETIREIQVYGNYDEEITANKEIYTYKHIKGVSHTGSFTKEVWQLNGEDHRMGPYPARSSLNIDLTEQFVDLQETATNSYSVEGIMISKNTSDVTDILEIKNYVDNALIIGTDPKEAIANFTELVQKIEESAIECTSLNNEQEFFSNPINDDFTSNLSFNPERAELADNQLNIEMQNLIDLVDKAKKLEVPISETYTSMASRFKESLATLKEHSVENQLSIELERTGEVKEDTKKRIRAYASLMEDKALMEVVESTDKEDLAALGEYFQELSQNDYVDYDTFANNQVQEMR